MRYQSLILLCLCIKFVVSQDPQNYYTAAVVGIANIYNDKAEPIKTLQNNTNLYRSYIAQAKAGGADIIVFPEYGITSLVFFRENMQKDELLPLSTVIPIEKYQKPNPCNDQEVTDLVSEVVLKLSCEAQTRQIYVVVNLIEQFGEDPDNVTFYNTNIVFDRDGAIIARYRKYNLYAEPFLTRPNQPEEVTFETDFGVTFGIFTCFDIIFENPALKLVKKNITHFVYPTAWISEMPFFTALQVQSGWARANNVNLLAAGFVDPKQYFGGMGIYSTQNITTSVPILLKSSMLLAKVPKNKFEVKPMFQPDERTLGTFAPGLNVILKDNREYCYKDLTETNNVGTVVYKNFTCSYRVEMDDIVDKNYTYKVIAYQGQKIIDNLVLPIQACGLVACYNQSLNSCGYINYTIAYLPSFPNLKSVEITANFANRNNSIVIPSLIDYKLSTLQSSDYTFERNQTTTLTVSRPRARMMTVGIVAHSYPNGASFIASKLSVLILTAILIMKNFY